MTRTSHRAPAVLLVVALLTSLVAVTAVRAAEPAEGTLSADVTEVTWTGLPQAPAFPTGDVGGQCLPAELDPGDVTCDHFLLTVDVDESFWADKLGGVRVAIDFPDGVDYELGVYRPGEVMPVASSATAASPEVVFIKNATGVYEVRATPYTNVNLDPYTGLAELTIVEADDPVSPGFQAFKGTEVAGEPPAEDFANPTTAYDGEPLTFQTVDVGRESAEPTIGVDKDGVAFYASGAFDGPGGALARTEIKRSTDGGKAWEDVTPKVADHAKHVATLDPYVYVEEDSGRVFDLDLSAADKLLSYSDDKGETWQTTQPFDPTNAVNDHQTIFAGPAPEGFPLPTLDPAFEEIVYYCFNKVIEAVCSRSLDGGATWSRTGAPAFPGFDPGAGGLCGGLHGHIATDNAGRLFLPKGHCGKPWIGISEDAGTTWEQVLVADMGFPEQQSSVDADAQDNLYYVWYDDVQQLPYLATSTDHGRTWSTPRMIAPPGVTEVQWPTVAAGDAGRITIGFPCSRAEGELAKSITRPWDYCVVMSTNVLDDDPTFISNTANPTGDPVHRGECPGRCGNMYDFLDIIVAPAEAGGQVWAAYTDTCTGRAYVEGPGPDGETGTEDDVLFPTCNTDPTAPGFDGSNDNASADMRGFAVKQLTGPILAAGADGPADGDGGPSGAPAEDEDTSGGPSLPATGGGLAALALGALSGGIVLRRRRD